MSKILAKGMITLTQLYEGAQVILTPAVVLIPCNSEETPKPNAYINASTNVKAFLGTMDITSGITLGELEYSDSTVRASKTGTKVSITTITTRTGYVDIPVSATINGETIDLGKHRFNFVKQIDGQTGQPGIPGDPGFGYTLNIKGGTRGIAYAANGTNPEPKTSSQFSVELLKNGVKVANPASISWTCGGNLSGSSSAATFTPTIKSTYASESSYVKVSIKEFAASLAVEETIPIICTKHADGLDWINEWNNQYVQVGTEKIITPKIFAGTKNGANELTGVAIGRDVLGGNANKVIGIVGYKKNTPVFSLDQDANFFVSSSGNAGDIKNGTNNAKGIYFDGNNLYVSGKVKISGGSTIGESNTLVEDVINNSNLGVQANNKIDNLSIGGRNLLRNTSLNGITFPYSGNDYNWRTASTNEGPGISRTKVAITDNDSFREIYGIKVVNTTSTAYNCDIAQDNVKMEDGATYTMSAYFKVISGNPTWRLQYGTNPYPVKTGTVKSGWNKCSYTFKYDKTQFSNKLTTNIYFGFFGANFEGYICGFKLEKGNKATDWSPAPEDIQIDINNAIDNIQIGGRNLVSDSNFGGFTSNAYGFGVRKVIGGLKNNTTYTFSANGRSNPNGNTEGKTLRCYIYESSWNHAWNFGISETSDTTRSLTFTTGNDIEGKDVHVAFYWFPSGGDRTGNATINWCKVEQGNKATDWTPAPEDVDSNIDDVKNSLNSFQNTVNTTFKDGIIEQAEAKAIAQHLKILDAEKADIDKEYSTIYSNANLTGSAKTNLASAKTSFDSAHANLKSTINTVISDGRVSSSESASVTSTFNTYNTQLGTYKQRVQEALDNIGSAKINGIQIGGRNLIRKADLGQNNSTATYDGTTNTWTVNATAGAGGAWGCGLIVKNKNASVPYGKAYVLSFEIKVPRACSWNCDVNNYALTGSSWSGNDNDVTSKRTTSSKSLAANQWIKCWVKWENTNPNNTNKVDIYDNSHFGVVMKDETSNMTYQIRNVKGELGNMPTEWTPAPEDIDSAINNQVNNAVTGLKVGGNNLLRNGNFAYDMANWSTHDMNSGGTNKSVTIGSGGSWIPEGKKAIVIRGTNTTDRYGVISSTMKLTPNTKYTISGYCAGHRVNRIQVNVRDVQNSHANIHAIDIKPVQGGNTLDKWYKFETTFTTTANSEFALNLYSINLGDNGYVWFTNVQVQEGTKATAWTPCSEDIDAVISAVNNKAQDSINKLTELASDSKLTASEKLVVKREWDAIVGEKTKITSEADKFGVSKTDYESKYNTLNSYITPLLSNLTTTSDINGSTFRSNFTNYYNSRQDLLNAITTKVKTLADNAQSTANTANNTANTVNTTVNNNKNNWSNAYNRVVEWASGAVTGSTNINGGMIATDTITAKQLAIGDFNNYSQLAKGKNLVNRHGTANWVEGANGHSYWQTTNTFFPFTVSETLNPFKAGDKIQIKFDAYTPSTRNVNVGVWFFSDTSASSNIGSVAGAVSCSASWGTKTVNLTLPTGNTYVQNAKSIAILIHNGSSGERIEVRNATVNRLVAGDLIVNGTITTDHIHTNGLNANVIKAGTISADRLDANTIVSKVNGGTTEINGNRIQTGTLSASKITTGTLDASKVNVTNIKAGNIVSGTIDASKISVTNLNASNITSGTLKGRTISGGTISGSTFTGGTLKSNNGDMLFDMNNGYMLLYNNGTKIAQTNKNSVAGTSIYGVSNGAEYGSYACLSAKVSSSASNYQMMITATGSDLPDANLKKGVNLGNTFNSNNWHFKLGSSTQLCWRQNGSNHDSFITEGSDGMLRVFGDNGMFLGYRNGNTNTFVIAIRENGSHTYPKSLSVFDDGARPATDNNGYSLEISAPLNMKGQSINQCSNIKTLGLEFIEPIAFNRNREGKTRTLKVTKNTQNIVEFIGSTAIKNGEAIVDLPSDVSFKNYVVLLTPIGLDRKVSIIEKNDDNFKIVGDDGIVDYVIKFESMDYANYIRKSISEDNTDIIVRSEEDKPKEIFIEN